MAKIKGTDKIIADLTSQGSVTGTIQDRERARLLVKTGLTFTTGRQKSLQDLYSIAGERPRIP